MLTAEPVLWEEAGGEEETSEALGWNWDKHFLGETYLACGRLFLGPVPGCWAMIVFLQELLPSSRKLMSDLWVLLAVGVTQLHSDDDILGKKQCRLEEGGLPFGILRRKFGQRPPSKAIIEWLLLLSSAWEVLLTSKYSPRSATYSSSLATQATQPLEGSLINWLGLNHKAKFLVFIFIFLNFSVLNIFGGKFQEPFSFKVLKLKVRAEETEQESRFSNFWIGLSLDLISGTICSPEHYHVWPWRPLSTAGCGPRCLWA